MARQKHDHEHHGRRDKKRTRARHAADATCTLNMVAERYKIDTGKLAKLIEFDKEAHDKTPKQHGTESSN